MNDAKKTILSRRAKFVAAAIAAAGIAVIDESRSRGAPPSSPSSSSSTRGDAGQEGGMGTPLPVFVPPTLERALALMNDEKLIEAREVFRELESRRRRPFDAGTDPITRNLRELDVKIPSLLVRTHNGSPPPRPLMVIIDDVERGLLGRDDLMLEINPGPHTFLIRREDDRKVVRREELVSREGERRRVISIDPDFDPDAPPRPCLQPLRYEDEHKTPSSHGCGCEIPGVRRKS